jgi:hypothetical protein
MNFAPAVYNLVEQFQKTTRTIAQMPEQSADDVAKKSDAYQAMATSRAMADMRSLADIPIAQFYIPKTAEYQAVLTTDGAFVRTWQGSDPLESERVAAARQMAVQKRFFHWFLEFPDIVARGGFDCILGNPPYLGGTLLSGKFGHNFCHNVKYMFCPAQLSELIVYFVLRSVEITKLHSFYAIISTNSIIDGAIRKDSLEKIVQNGNELIMAKPSIKWPGKANVYVTIFVSFKGNWTKKRMLNDKQVDSISVFLDDEKETLFPSKLDENKDIITKGSNVVGEGFLISHEEAAKLISLDKRNLEVIYKVINGDEVNNQPNQEPQRSIINFHNFEKNIASSYLLPFNIVENLVKPYRQTQTQSNLREKWWLYNTRNVQLSKAINVLKSVFVASITTKYLNFSQLDSGIVFTSAIYILITDRWDLYSIVQSTIHEVWARKYSGALETRLRYSPSDCFETFAFPAGIWQQTRPELATIGAQYHEHRRRLMLHLWLGLTDVYNLFHSPRLDEAVQKHYTSRARKDPQGLAIPAEHRAAALAYSAAQALADIQQLRALHVALDTAVLAAYGWSDLDLAHDFYDVDTLTENDRTRYTISPDARRELLSRLLTENHARAAQEARDVTPGAGKRAPKRATPSDQGVLFE